eukprot:m.235420 g.235420  ORF g.235420 m.235420 type:complete len:91 (+) comp20063_c0_seq1:1118-1390(+)
MSRGIRGVGESWVSLSSSIDIPGSHIFCMLLLLFFSLFFSFSDVHALLSVPSCLVRARWLTPRLNTHVCLCPAGQCHTCHIFSIFLTLSF